MYTGDHVDACICAVCGDTLTPPSDGGCWICWHGTDRGMLKSDEQLGFLVHQQCLDWFGVDNLLQ